MTCDHSWEHLNVFIRNRVIHADGSEEALANVAWCDRCGERWDLSDAEVSAAEALLDGRMVAARSTGKGLDE